RKNGIGESQRTSVTMGTGVYYYALKLNDDMIIRIASATNDVLKIFVGISIPAIVIISIIYMLTVVVAMSLTKNITKPILDIDLDEKIETDNVYDELAPFVTKIRQQNKKINKQLDKLNIQKIRLGVITDNMSEGLIVINNEMTVLSVNKSVANMFRLEDNDIKGKNFLYITRDMHINDCVKLTLLGQKGILEFTQNGKNYQLFSSPVLEGGIISGAVVLIVDITEKVKSEQIRREFSANVSHELKTPLTTILGYSQIINTGMAKPKDIEGFNKKIEKEAMRLLRLIEDVIKQSKLDEKNEHETEKIELEEVVNDVVLNLSGKISEHELSVSSEGNSIIYGDKTMINELVFNLVENAIKYNKQSGKIMISICELDGKTSLSIADTGIGIPEDDIDRIFERFYRCDKSRSRDVDGTGLGLSIVKHIAIWHKATINTQSQLGKGTKITITFG
ncbi:MAG: ATP-binding protein, partial [Oscillospiraceae bacterium]